MGEGDHQELDDFGVPKRKKPKDPEDPEAAYEQAFSALMRSEEPGMSGLSSEQRQLLRRNVVVEQRAPQATTPGNVGGFLIPTTMVRTILETMKAYGGIRQYATVINTAAGEEMAVAHQ